MNLLCLWIGQVQLNMQKCQFKSESLLRGLNEALSYAKKEKTSAKVKTVELALKERSK